MHLSPGCWGGQKGSPLAWAQHPTSLPRLGSQAGPCCVCGAAVLVTDGLKRRLASREVGCHLFQDHGLGEGHVSGCPSLEGHDQEAPVWQAACVASQAKNTLCGLRAPFNVARPLSYSQMSEGCAPSGSFITIQLSVTNIDPHLLRARRHTRHGDPQLCPPRSAQGAEETAWKALERSGTQLKDGLFCLRGRWGEESRRMSHGEEMMFMLGRLRVCAGAGAPSCAPLVCLERKRGQGCWGGAGGSPGPTGAAGATLSNAHTWSPEQAVAG